MDRKKTKWTGVYQLTSTKHKHKGKPDVCYYVTYKKDGKKVWEKVGWKSDGYSAETASLVRGERVRAVKHSDIPAVATSKITMQRAWKLYLDQHMPTIKDQKTEISAYNKHIKPALEAKHLDQIGPYDIEKIKKRMTDQGYAPATVKHILVLIRSIYNRMLEWGKWHGVNPVSRVKMPKVDNARWRYLTWDESHALLQEIGRRSATWYIISLISLHCGLRAGEVFALRGEHIDMDNGILQVIDPKHKSRQAYMTPAVKATLAGLETQPSKLIFQNRNGEQITEVSETIPRAIQKLGLNKDIQDRRGKVVFHTFRHTFGSWLAMDGWPMYVIAELMGHSTLEMTRRYSHLSPGHKQSAISGLHKFFMAGQSFAQFPAPNTPQYPADDTK